MTCPKCSSGIIRIRPGEGFSIIFECQTCPFNWSEKFKDRESLMASVAELQAYPGASLFGPL